MGVNALRAFGTRGDTRVRLCRTRATRKATMSRPCEVRVWARNLKRRSGQQTRRSPASTTVPTEDRRTPAEGKQDQRSRLRNINQVHGAKTTTGCQGAIHSKVVSDELRN